MPFFWYPFRRLLPAGADLIDHGGTEFCWSGVRGVISHLPRFVCGEIYQGLLGHNRNCSPVRTGVGKDPPPLASPMALHCRQGFTTTKSCPSGVTSPAPGGMRTVGDSFGNCGASCFRDFCDGLGVKMP